MEPPTRRPETATRLEDIAQHLSQLAQRERQSAAIMPYEAPRHRSEDRDTLNRILSRIDNNERQAVDAFTAVNERLSVLGNQIAQVKPKAIEKPEDVPGYMALESAIRNVVEHLEISENRTRGSLKAMQDRLGEMVERATQPNNPDDIVRAAPAFSSLEARIADLAGRMQRSENLLHSGLPDAVRKELNLLTERIESVRASSEHLAARAQEAATGASRNELRDIEARILGVLKEAQTTIGSQQSAIADIQRLRGEVGGLNKRIEEVGQATASERDVHALRVAVEQLSTRVAQGSDTRPIAEMERRLVDISRRLDQDNASARSLPQFGELERRVAALDHRLAEAMRTQGGQQAVQALEQHISAVNERVSRTEDQLGHLETMERAIHQLYDSLEQSRSNVSQTAEEAANRAVERVLSTKAQADPSPELRAMEEGLRAVRESAANAEQRNQETLEAVHETLEQIVSKLAELETAAAGHQLALNMAQQAGEPAQPLASPPLPEASAAPAIGIQPQFYDPDGVFEQQPFDGPAGTAAAWSSSQPAPAGTQSDAAGAQSNIPEPPQPRIPEFAGTAPQPSVPDTAASASPGGDDFIAAARRAAQAAASRSNITASETKTMAVPSLQKPSAFSIFRKKQTPAPITYVNGQPVSERPAALTNENKRRKLVLAGIVLLAAVSAFAFNILGKPKVVKQTSSLDAPALMVPGVPGSSHHTIPSQSAVNALGPQPTDKNQGLTIAGEPAADAVMTGSIPVKKTDATLASIVAEPRESRAETPPPESGSVELRSAAARGDAKAQFIIASRYLDGQGVTQDLPKAAYWYQLAAERGLAPAQYRLATLFERGKGVPQDPATALLWYERAAAGGNVKSMHNAAVIAAGNQAGTPDYDKAFRWFKSAAERGLHDSQFNLAVLYERGLGTPIDRKEAHFWYSLAAKQGDGDAAKRANKLAATLAAPEVARAAERLASWSPLSSADDANVVTLADPAWSTEPQAQTPEAKVTASEPAVPMQPMPEPEATPEPVAEVQDLLTKLGYNVGDADGRMGSRTANAIRLFQLQSGMKVTGKLSPDVLDAIRAKSGT
jgi:localization factor PodJL